MYDKMNDDQSNDVTNTTFNEGVHFESTTLLLY